MSQVAGSSLSLPPSTLLLVVDAGQAPPPAPASASASASVTPGAAAPASSTSELASVFSDLKAMGHASITVLVAVNPRNRDMWGTSDSSSSSCSNSSGEGCDPLSSIMDACMAAGVNMVAVPVPDQAVAKTGTLAHGVYSWVLDQAVQRVPEGIAVEGVACMPGGKLPVLPWVAGLGLQQEGGWEGVVEAAGLKPLGL